MFKKLIQFAFAGVALSQLGADAQTNSYFQMMCLRQGDGDNRTLSRAQAELGVGYRIGGGGVGATSGQYVFSKKGETCYVYADPATGRVASVQYSAC